MARNVTLRPVLLLTADVPLVGSTLSHYRIVDELGRGGMGIVYLAEDTKLDRQVAIKVLPPSALASEDDRARFYREAKAAAALNHPSIAQIYQIDEAVPSDAPHGTEPSPFIAMEYIDGETLDARIKKGPLKLKEAVRLATQIAGALGEAHEKGIVHRDVKASNVMLTSKGDAKVLDFGLALTAASTKLTRMGSTLGTVAYMSPEQARGEEVDRRTDLWALGVVLYEMIAGRNPFGGDYEQAVVYSILNADPEPLTAVRTGVPMQLEWTVNKLLSKDADLRYQSAAGLLADLKALDLSGSGHSRSGMSAVSAASTSAVGAQPATDRLPGWMPVVLGAVVLALGMALGAVLFGGGNGSGIEHAAFQTSILVNSGHPDYPRLSEDGRYLSFNSHDDGVYEQVLFDLVTGEERRFPTDRRGLGSSISPDGRWLVWVDGTETWRAPTSGGPAVKLGLECEFPMFLNNERLICHVREGERRPLSIVIVDLDGNETGPVVAPDTANGIRSMLATDVLPGERFAVGAIISDSPPRYQLAVADIESGELQRLHQQGDMPRYVGSGHLVFLGTPDDTYSAQLVLARPFDADTRQFTGPAVPITDDLVPYWGLDATVSGLIVYTIGLSVTDEFTFEWLDMAGNRLDTIPLAPDDYETMALSPDGSQLAVTLEDDSEETEDVFLIDVDTGTQRRLTFTTQARQPAWSSDGTAVYLRSDFEGEENVLVAKPADGSGGLAKVFSDAGDVQRLHLSSSGGMITYETYRQDGSDDIVIRSLTDPDSLRIIDREEDLYEPRLSRDGRYVAYRVEGEGFYVQEAWGDAFWTVPMVDQASTSMPRWSPDGDWLYFRARGQLWRAGVHFEPTFRFDPPETLFEWPRGALSYEPHPDGERILFTRRLIEDTHEAPDGQTMLTFRANLGALLNVIAPPSE